MHKRTIAQNSSGICIPARCTCDTSFDVAYLYICSCFASYVFAILLYLIVMQEWAV